VSATDGDGNRQNGLSVKHALSVAAWPSVKGEAGNGIAGSGDADLVFRAEDANRAAVICVAAPASSSASSDDDDEVPRPSSNLCWRSWCRIEAPPLAVLQLLLGVLLTLLPMGVLLLLLLPL